MKKSRSAQLSLTFLPEPKVKDLVKRWYDRLRAWSYAPVQNGMGEHGIPDRVGCVPVIITQDMVGKVFGMFVAIECKGGGRRGEKDRGCTPNQVKQLKGIGEANGVALVCDGEDDLRSLDWILQISPTTSKSNA